MMSEKKEEPVINKYEIYSNLTIEVRTIIEASSEEEALKIAKERGVIICWHGTADHDAEDNWVMVNDSHEVKPYISDIL
jgi:hypothetical protein